MPSSKLSLATSMAGATVSTGLGLSGKGPKFWLIFSSLCICLFLSALEVSSISTALPTIANALHAEQFTWVGSAYALAATAFLPMSGGIAQAFGRRPAIMLTIGLFTLGSGISGGAVTMNMLIAGRTIQGLGAGGIESLTMIVLADLVSLQERGIYVGFFAFVWAVAASVGPLIGGGLAASGHWRWLFYLNLPIATVACALVVSFMDLPVPPGTWREKLTRMDWMGNLLVISSTVACTIGLTWGGITFPWNSAKVLVPLIFGILGLAAFITYEAIYPKYPLVPFSLVKNRTSLSGYIQIFLSTVVLFTIIYYGPVYFQACKGASPVLSGIYELSFASLGITAIAGGIWVKISSKYQLPLWTGWVINIIGFGLASTVRSTDPLWKAIAFTGLLGLGTGFLQATAMYPIQAPLPVTQNAPALAFLWFLRTFAIVWGITIGSTVLQNELAKKFPALFLASIPDGTAIIYALIPQISSLPPAIRYEVREAFANSLQVLWRVSAVISAAGLLVSFFMEALPLSNLVDEDWTLQEEKSHDSPGA